MPVQKGLTFVWPEDGWLQEVPAHNRVAIFRAGQVLQPPRTLVAWDLFSSSPPRSLFRLTSPSGVGYKTRTGVWGGGVYLKSTIQLSPFGLVRSLGVLQVTPSTASKAHHDTMTFLIFYGRTMQLLRVPSWCLSLWIYGIGTGRVSPAFFGVQQECGGNGCHHMARLTTIEGTDAKRYERLCCSLSRDGKWFRQSCRNRCPAFEPVEETSS